MEPNIDANLQASANAEAGVHAQTSGERSKSVYHVEVSGWNHKQEFFSERAAMDWSEGKQKSVWLRKSVRIGTLVFVRLLETSSESKGAPIACRVREVYDRGAGAAFELVLTQIWPSPENQYASPAEMLAEACGSPPVLR